jgi:hypothetical protein
MRRAPGSRQAKSHLNPDQIDRFKSEHLAEIQAVATKVSLWLDIKVIFAVGRKP